MRSKLFIVGLLAFGSLSALAFVNAQEGSRRPGLLPPQHARSIAEVGENHSDAAPRDTQRQIVSDFQQRQAQSGVVISRERQSLRQPPSVHVASQSDARMSGGLNRPTTTQQVSFQDGDKKDEPPVPSILSGRPTSPRSNTPPTQVDTVRPPAGEQSASAGTPVRPGGSPSRLTDSTNSRAADTTTQPREVPIETAPRTVAQREERPESFVPRQNPVTGRNLRTQTESEPINTAMRPRTQQARPQPSGITANSTGAQLTVLASGPETIKVGKPAQYRIRVDNISQIAAQGVQVKLNLPAWVSVIDTETSQGAVERQASTTGGSHVWEIPEIAANSWHQLSMQLVVNENRPFDFAFDWSTAALESKTRIEVTQPDLAMSIDGPRDIEHGEKAVFHFTISNPGNGQAENVVIALPESLGGQRANLGDIDAGSQETFEVELTARQAGQMLIEAVATADGGLQKQVEHRVQVRRAQLDLSIQAPQFKYAGSIADYRIVIQNTGDAPARGVMAAAALPSGSEYVNGIAEAVAVEGGIRWEIGDIPAGGRLQYTVQCKLDEAGTAHFEAGARSGSDLSAADAADTVVEAVADLTLEVSDPRGPLPVGEEVIYELTIRNRGTRAATDVAVLAQFSAGIEPTEGVGGKSQIADGQVAFEPIPMLSPGQEVTLKVKAVADEDGNHIFRAHLQCDDPDTHRVFEGSTRFFISADQRQANTAASQSQSSSPSSLRVPR